MPRSLFSRRASSATFERTCSATALPSMICAVTRQSYSVGESASRQPSPRPSSLVLLLARYNRATMLGTVAAIWRYPVKSMMGEELNACEVTSRGVAGDRAYAFIDADNRIGTAKIQRRWRHVFQSRARYLEEPDGAGVTPAEITLPDGSRLMTSELAIDATFARLLGFEARLVSEKPAPLKLESAPLDRPFDTEGGATVDFPVVNGFFDLGSLHLLTTGTLDTL